jgi:hypothetical protein
MMIGVDVPVSAISASAAVMTSVPTFVGAGIAAGAATIEEGTIRYGNPSTIG